MKAAFLTSAALLVALTSRGARGDAPEHPQGRLWSGEGLEGYVFSSSSFPPGLNQDLAGTGPLGTLTLTNLSVCKPAGATKDDPTIPPRAYRCKVKHSKPICAGATPGGDPSKPVSVILVEGSWSGSVTPAWTPTKYTASCSVDNVPEWKEAWTGTLAKCTELWHMNTSSQLLTACVHMARAAYKGDLSYTYPGTMVDAWDVEPASVKQQHEAGCKMINDNPNKYKAAFQKDICEMWLEAEWDQRGAICVNHCRYEDLVNNPSSPDTKETFAQFFPRKISYKDLADRQARSLNAKGKDSEAAPPAATASKPPPKSGKPEPQRPPATAAAPPKQPCEEMAATLHCRADVFDAAALVGNRSRLNDHTTGVPAALPAGPRSDFDTPECVALCGLTIESRRQR